MSFEWSQLNPERFEYRSVDDRKACVAEVLQRCGTYYEAVVFQEGQRSRRLLLHRGDSVGKAMDAVVLYFSRQTLPQLTRTPDIQRTQAARQF